MSERAQTNAASLLARHLSGDASAFGELVMHFRAQVYSYLIRSGVSDSARDDLFQEIFFKVHSSARSYDTARALEPWLFTIVANTVRSHFRKQKSWLKIFDSAEPPDHPATEKPDQLSEARETKAFLDDAVRKLPEAQREAVILCCIEQLNQQDVANILGIPLNTLKTNLSRGRQALAKSLARRAAIAQREVRS